MERLKKFYAVNDGWGGQKGDFIIEIKITESEYRNETASPNNRKNRAIFRKYIEALYYIQD